MRLRQLTAVTALVAVGATACAADDLATVADEPATSAVAAPRIGATRPLALTDPAATPPLDRQQASVDASMIQFDTFDGGSISLELADDDTISALRDLIAPIDAPAYESVGSAAVWMPDDDVVLAYTDESGGEWAYPVRTLNFHEIVNDELAGVPVLISYCPLCSAGVVYDRRIEGRELSFSNTSALHQSDLVMVDRETGSYWWQVAGRAIVGPLTDSALTTLPSSMQRWSAWSTAHPDGSVLSRLPGEEFLPDPFMGMAERIDTGLTPRDLAPGVLDDRRLSPGSTVVVADFGGSPVAWPVEPARTFHTEISGRGFTVNTDGTGATITDSETGEPKPLRTSLWFAVVASFPGTKIGDEPAQPG